MNDNLINKLTVLFLQIQNIFTKEITVMLFLLMMATLLSAYKLLKEKNSIFALFHLISIYLMSYLMLIILQSNFLALLILLVYIGAITVLFLFVIMMINLTPTISHKFFITEFLMILVAFIPIILIVFTDEFIRQSDLYKNMFESLDLIYFQPLSNAINEYYDLYLTTLDLNNSALIAIINYYLSYPIYVLSQLDLPISALIDYLYILFYIELDYPTTFECFMFLMNSIYILESLLNLNIQPSDFFIDNRYIDYLLYICPYFFKLIVLKLDMGFYPLYSFLGANNYYYKEFFYTIIDYILIISDIELIINSVNNTYILMDQGIVFNQYLLNFLYNLEIDTTFFSFNFLNNFLYFSILSSFFDFYNIDYSLKFMEDSYYNIFSSLNFAIYFIKYISIVDYIQPHIDQINTIIFSNISELQALYIYFEENIANDFYNSLAAVYILSEIRAIASVLYIEYSSFLIIAGILLFIALIGAVVLTRINLFKIQAETQVDVQIRRKPIIRYIS